MKMFSTFSLFKKSRGVFFLASFKVVFLAFLSTSFLVPLNAQELKQSGTYQVNLANKDNHLNCRSGPDFEYPVHSKLKNGSEIMVLKVLTIDNTWFLTNLGCYVRAHSSYLKQVNVKSETTKKVISLPIKR